MMRGPDIILCDDKQELREVIGEYLTSRGFAVREAESAAALMRLVDERAPDAIVLDVRMPGGGRSVGAAAAQIRLTGARDHADRAR